MSRTYVGVMERSKISVDKDKWSEGTKSVVDFVKKNKSVSVVEMDAFISANWPKDEDQPTLNGIFAVGNPLAAELKFSDGKISLREKAHVKVFASGTAKIRYWTSATEVAVKIQTGTAALIKANIVSPLAGKEIDAE